MTRAVIVTPNPALDVTYRVARQQLGDTHRVFEVAQRPGGKGLNVARVLHAVGVETLSVLPLGGVDGATVDREVRSRGLEVASVPIVASTRRTLTVVDGLVHPTVYAEPGPVLTPAEWARLDREIEGALTDASALVISGSLPSGADPNRVGTWVRMAAARGLPIVADVSGHALVAAADAGASVLKPNVDELRESTGLPESVAAAELRSRGAGAVIVSHGASGLRVYDGGDVRIVPAVRGVSGNPTGAGDAATAGLVAALLEGAGLIDAAHRAAIFGAAAVLQPAAGDIDPADIQRLRIQHDRDADGAAPEQKWNRP